MVAENVYVDVDLNVFSLDAVKAASYRFAEFAPSLVVRNEENKVRVSFSLNSAVESTQAKSIIDEFNVSLVDYDLRETIRNETEATRNLILAYAFADSKLVEE